MGYMENGIKGMSMETSLLAKGLGWRITNQQVVGWYRGWIVTK